MEREEYNNKITKIAVRFTIALTPLYAFFLLCLFVLGSQVISVGVYGYPPISTARTDILLSGLFISAFLSIGATIGIWANRSFKLDNY